MSAALNNRFILANNKADIIRTLSYLDVAAHLLSRGVISMPEHRQVFALSDEVSRVNKLIEIISDRKDSVKHLIHGMEDSSLHGKYKPLIQILQCNINIEQSTEPFI